MAELFESVPNFSEGRRADVIREIAAPATPASLLDVDADPDHNRFVVTLAGGPRDLTEALLVAASAAVRRIDLREHRGVHPRVGAVDVVPIVPLGDASLDHAHELARALGQRLWADLGVPVYFYGFGEAHTLADIRSGRAPLSLGGPGLHPTAGAVCIGARPLLVAFNVVLYGVDMVGARALARSIRESGAGLRGVQALAFPLSGERVQLSMNLFRLEVTKPDDVIAELERRGVSLGAQQVVGLCPATAAGVAASGRILEGRLAAGAARRAAVRARALGGDERSRLATRLEREAEDLAALPADQDALLAGAERASALVRVLPAAGIVDDEGRLQQTLQLAARGLAAALSEPTRSLYGVRVAALERALKKPA